ncbi:MAG: PIG-L family deacetylase [Acidobacteriaceae bacterium]|nr:PIG-L family deacetylase [Acidobacteriaceae bacterium]
MRRRFAPLAFATLFAATASPVLAKAQAPAHFTDPANLARERVEPRDGRELPVDQGRRGLEQMLRRISTRASVLNIVAHPDDEDGGMLTFYARGMGAQVADLSLTRGEGGQNAMTGDFEDALGLLRTQELLANDRYTGVSQMFGTEVDFGFSKTKAETFGKWTHERVLYDAVRAIRIFRPLVLTSTWIGGVTDGHGQHQVSGEITQEAFLAAGDPKVFPEMEQEGIYPWKPLRVYARVPHSAISEKGLYDYATNQYVPAEFHNYVSGKDSPTSPSTDVIVHEGNTDPLLSAEGEAPVSYIQFARRGLSEQKSQMGPGMRSAPAGAFDVAYHLYGSRICGSAESLASCIQPAYAANDNGQADFFHGIDTSIAGIADLAPNAPASLRKILQRVADLLAQANTKEQAGDLEGVSKLLQSSVDHIDTALHTLTDPHTRGIDFAPHLDDAEGFGNISQEEFASLSHELLVKHSQLEEARMFALNIQAEATISTPSNDLETGSPFTIHLKVKSPSDSPHGGKLSNTWVASTHQTHMATDGTDVFEVSAAEAGRFPTTLPYFHRANVEQPYYDVTDTALRNAPLAPAPLIVNESFMSHTGGRIELPFAVNAEGTLQPIQFVPNDPAERKRIRSVGYDDLPRTNFIERPARFAPPANLQLPKKRRIAYLPGTGDSVPDALAAIGLPVTKLEVSDLTQAGLADFDTVILGVRTYAAHPDLHGAPTQALLDFARDGGNVVVQYQTMEYTAADAPFPLSLGANEKVVDETAAVKLLSAQDPLLTTPNHITSADFNGWIEERGHGFMATWDPQYTALTETHDPGAPAEHILPQKPQLGGLLTAKVGKGHYTYVAFALYRQFPEAVPGAFRLFANLLSQ